MARFDSDTALTRAADGHYRARISEDWSIGHGGGPNGGYLAAIVLRAMGECVAATDQPPRVVTTHFLRPPVPGEADVHVTVERAGRTLTTVTARLEQAGRVAVLAIAAFGANRDSFALDEHDALPYAAPAGPAVVPPAGVPPIAERYDFRLVDDPRVTRRGVIGGWLAFEDRRSFDAAALVAAADAWLPVLGVHAPEPVALPTIELTVHLRRALPPAGAGEWLACRFRSTLVADGYVEEDGELWAPGLGLVAISRQLSAVQRRR